MSHQALGFLGTWAVMCAVMMVPTAMRPARRLAGRSAGRAIAFLVAYAVAWSVTGLIAYPVVVMLPWNSMLLFLAWLAVGAYQALPTTARHLRSCRSLKSSAAPAGAGLRYGRSCIAACLPLMITSMATIHVAGLPGWAALMTMAALCGFLMWQKEPAVSPSATRYSGVAIIGVAALIFAAVGPGAGHGDHAPVPAERSAS